MYTFTGNLIIQQQTLPLSPNQLLLRVWLDPFIIYIISNCLCYSFIMAGEEGICLVTLFFFFWCMFSLLPNGAGIAAFYSLVHVCPYFTQWSWHWLFFLFDCVKGCSLRNTEYIVGAVVYTGHETKVRVCALCVENMGDMSVPCCIVNVVLFWWKVFETNNIYCSCVIIHSPF